MIKVGINYGRTNWGLVIPDGRGFRTNEKIRKYLSRTKEMKEEI